MASSDRLRIGYAFAPNKEQSIIQPSLVDYAKLRGVDLVRIDLQISLLQQAPFDCVIHKLYDESWVQQLREFASKNPDVVVVDRPELISRLHDRVSMLEVVNELKMAQSNVKIEVPKQVVVYESDVQKDSGNAFRDLGLKFPVIAKPLEANGSAKSHEMCLVFNRGGLKELTTPVVLQEFVNHGGVVFKVYVAGKQAVCVKRKSLPDVSETEQELEKLDGAMKFSRISRLENQDNHGKSEKCNGNSGGGEEEKKNVEMPPLNLVMEIARGLREAMGLRLFNFDMIRDENNTYFVIDINYLPGYAVMPNYEPFLTRFFKEVGGKEEEEASTSIADVKEDQEAVVSNGDEVKAAPEGH